MKRKSINIVNILAAGFGIMLLVFGGVSVHSQDDIEWVKDSAFGERLRAPVSFLHDAHNEKAGIDECHVCHHTYEDGKKSESDSSEGMACSECHPLKNSNNPISLATYYHLQCKGCHQEQGKGPIMCSECHRK